MKNLRKWPEVIYNIYEIKAWFQYFLLTDSIFVTVKLMKQEGIYELA